MSEYKGKFITFEGGEGVGKSRLIYNLSHSKLLKSDTVFTKEPGAGTSINKGIRHLLMESHMDVETETLLFLADRSEHLKTLVNPALKIGTNVLCDRYADSTLVYQCHVKGFDPLLLNIFSNSLRHTKPDLTFWLDMDPAEALERRRLHGHQTKFDKESIDFHIKVRSGFEKVARHSPHFVRIDASQSEEKVLHDVWSSLKSLLDSSWKMKGLMPCVE